MVCLAASLGTNHFRKNGYSPGVGFGGAKHYSIALANVENPFVGLLPPLHHHFRPLCQ